MAGSNTGMEKSVMKRLFAQSSPDVPIKCAFALGNDRRTALAMFDKIKGARALSGEITKANADAKTPSFGTAHLDPADETLLKLTVNKLPPGLGKRLLRTLRGTGVKHLSFFDESGALLEKLDDDEEEDEAGAGTDAAASGQAAPNGAGGQSLVAKRVFLLERWRKIPGELRVQVSALNGRIVERLPHEDADAFCAQMNTWFDDMLSEMQASLDDAIDASINAGDNAYRPVATALDQFRDRVANDSLVAFMKQSDLLDGAVIETAFISAFDEIGNALTTS